MLDYSAFCEAYKPGDSISITEPWIGVGSNDCECGE